MYYPTSNTSTSSKLFHASHNTTGLASSIGISLSSLTTSTLILSTPHKHFIQSARHMASFSITNTEHTTHAFLPTFLRLSGSSTLLLPTLPSSLVLSTQLSTPPHMQPYTYMLSVLASKLSSTITTRVTSCHTAAIKLPGFSCVSTALDALTTPLSYNTLLPFYSSNAVAPPRLNTDVLY